MKKQKRKKPRGRHVKRTKKRQSKIYSKKKSKPKKQLRKNRKSKSRKIKRSPRRSRKKYSVSRRTGWSKRVHVRNSKFFGGGVVVKKHEVRLAQKEKIKLRGLNNIKLEKLIGLAQSVVRSQYERDNDSLNNLFFLRLRYTYKLRGKKEESYFATPTAEIESEEQLDFLTDLTMREFLSHQNSYIGRGFSNIQFEGAMLTTYEADKLGDSFSEPKRKNKRKRKGKKKR